MMNKDERFVRDAWENIRFEASRQYGDSSKPIYFCWYIDDWLAISGYDTIDKITAAARKFTEERLEQILLVEEEIAWLKSLSIPMNDIAAAMRVGRREEAALAELQRGMKAKGVSE